MKRGILERKRGGANATARRKAIGVALSALVMLFALSPAVRAAAGLPDTLRVASGQDVRLALGLPFSVRVTDGSVRVVSSGDETLQSAVSLRAEGTGASEVSLDLLGLIPFKRVAVHVSPDTVLIPGGQAVGVALRTDGVLVVGTSDLGGEGGGSPARLAGIRPGDFLLSVDGVPLSDAAHLTRLVEAAGGRALDVRLLRDGEERRFSLAPRRDSVTGAYRLGAWVRDSTAGVGTLSFVSPMTGAYGALGHAITDGDTGRLLTVRDGRLMTADIVDVKRGQKGTPGELKGSFLRDGEEIGGISANSVYGIYGKLDRAPAHPLYPNGLPIGLRDAVHTGPATILSTVSGEGMREYAVEITRVARQSQPAQKSMVIRVTDPALLEKTGGIVQGMSGSPILQDGRIVGAVTHVYVNDPTQGYGLFIEWMLEAAASAQ